MLDVARSRSRQEAARERHLGFFHLCLFFLAGASDGVQASRGTRTGIIFVGCLFGIAWSWDTALMIPLKMQAFCVLGNSDTIHTFLNHPVDERGGLLFCVLGIFIEYTAGTGRGFGSASRQPQIAFFFLGSDITATQFCP